MSEDLLTDWDEYRTATWSKHRSLKDNLDHEAIKQYWEERANES